MTRLFRHSFMVFARLALGLLLFTQLSNLAQACAMAELNPAAAFGSAAMSGCNGMQDTANKATCLFHCLQDSQVAQSEKASLVAPAMDTHHAGPPHIALPESTRASPQGNLSAPLNFAERPRYLRFGHFLN